MSTPEPKRAPPMPKALKAECCDFKDGSTRIQIKLFIDGKEETVFTVSRRHAAEVVRQINGV